MRIEVSIDLPASPEEVWRYVSDLARNVEWMGDADSVFFTSDATEGVGTTFDSVSSIGPVRTTDHMTVTEWNPPDDAAGSDGAASPVVAAGSVAAAQPVASLGVSHSGSAGAGRSSRLTLTPITADGAAADPAADAPADTRFTWTGELRPRWYAGGPLSTPVAARVLRKLWRRNLRRLRVKIIERSQSGAPDEPGAVIGLGRDSEVRTYGDNVIRISTRDADLGHEAEAMAHVAAHGFPAPALVDQPTSSSIVMERLDGPTMLEDMTAKPWLAPRHARKLAALHHELGLIEAPAHWTQVCPGSAVCHLGMTPDDVKMTARGLVVIDWSNAARGDAAFDAALTYVALRTTPHVANAVSRAVVAAMRRQFAQRFLKAFGEDDLLAQLRGAAELRLLDRNLMPDEREAVFALARGELD
ncbi:MAG TPA: hypothetical protein DEP66_04275 [Acidimicrobiaceae bacterium]|nr:hypothetical protein [Acidimicrobiaceae bacterium]HCB37419.1 hypothetical protein [Acidimicrobiaceae bacterium]